MKIQEIIIDGQPGKMVEYPDGRKTWWVNGVLRRMDDPAVSGLPPKILQEIERLSTALAENCGLTQFQRNAVENLMYRTANMVLIEQARLREVVAREVCGRLTLHPVKDFVGEL